MISSSVEYQSCRSAYLPLRSSLLLLYYYVRKLLLSRFSVVLEVPPILHNWQPFRTHTLHKHTSLLLLLLHLTYDSDYHVIEQFSPDDCNRNLACTTHWPRDPLPWQKRLFYRLPCKKCYLLPYGFLIFFFPLQVFIISLSAASLCHCKITFSTRRELLTAQTSFQ